MGAAVFSEAELAHRLGESTTTLAAWRKKGHGPHWRLEAGCPVYRKAAVERWLSDSLRELFALFSAGEPKNAATTVNGSILSRDLVLSRPCLADLEGLIPAGAPAPRPARLARQLPFEEVDRGRAEECVRYSTCLRRAALEGWMSFSCVTCPGRFTAEGLGCEGVS